MTAAPAPDTRPVGGCQRLEGRAVDAAGQPVKGMDILQHPRSGGPVEQVPARTDSTDRFTGFLLGGPLLVSPTSVPGVQDATTPNLQVVSYGFDDLETDEPACAKLDGAGHARVVDLVMRPGAILTGRVTPGPGVETYSVNIALASLIAGQRTEAPFLPLSTLNTGGRYRFVGLPTTDDMQVEVACNLIADPAHAYGDPVTHTRLTAGRTTTLDLAVPCSLAYR